MELPVPQLSPSLGFKLQRARDEFFSILKHFFCQGGALSPLVREHPSFMSPSRPAQEGRWLNNTFCLQGRLPDPQVFKNTLSLENRLSEGCDRRPNSTSSTDHLPGSCWMNRFPGRLHWSCTELHGAQGGGSLPVPKEGVSVWVDLEPSKDELRSWGWACKARWHSQAMA